MDVALGLFAFWPALALGSFLNVVAARVPLRRSVVRPASACMSCGTELAWYDNVPVLSWLLLRGRCRTCGVRISPLYPLVELATAALVAALLRRVRALSGEAFVGLVLLRRARRAERDRPRAPDRPEPDRRARGGDRARWRRRRSHPSPEWALGALGASGFLFVAALAYPAGMGMGDVKLALLLGAMLGRLVGVGLMLGMFAALVPSVVPARPPRLGGAQDGHPVRAVPGAGRADRPVCGRNAARRVSEPLLALSFHAGFCRYLVRGIPWTSSGPTSSGCPASPAPPKPPPGATPGCPRATGVNEVAELVADLIEATGLVSADRLAAVRGRVKQGGSFAQAVLDEGVATPEGLARTLASRFQLPFVDLPLIGVDEEAAGEIPIHVLERVVALPYALEGNTLRIAVADPGNVHAIDELRLATRYQLELGVASREDIENEIRRLARASEAFGAAMDAEDALLGEEVAGGEPTTSRSTTASPTSRSSGSSTRSSSRRPRTGPATSTSSRRRTRSSCGFASTACCTRCSASRSG